MRCVLPSPCRGIGALTASGNSKIFAFSEQKLFPSIFVYIFPELQLKNELKGKVLFSLKCLKVTPWNWETAEPICTQPQAGQDVISLVFNPLNWQQLCALGTTFLTVWNIEKSANFHLPATDGSFVERLEHTSYTVSDKLPYYGPEMASSAISGLKGDKTETNTLSPTICLLTPTAICWTATSQLYVGCEEGFLLLVDPESLSVSVLINPKGKQSCTLRYVIRNCQLLQLKSTCAFGLQESVVHCLQIKGTQLNVTKTRKLEGAVTTAMFSPDYDSLLLTSNTVST
uniref:Cilia- and flagella-associated protein 43 n=1 Tax=Monopterus albus TaxID=43700 RepID=A0A3Q3QZY7_MONAL